LYEVVRKLRSPEGCPWDKEQTPSTLRGGLIEETFECIEAINDGDPAHIKEELGDVFLLATMISYMFEQEEKFSVSDVLEGISGKLIRRHPHVFGDARVKDSSEVLDNWARIKTEQEGRPPKDSILDEVRRSFPPLERACKLQKKAAKAGFDWESAEDVFLKIDEELEEVRDARENPTKDNVEGELGDLLFSVVNLCRFLDVDPSVAIARCNDKFTERFKYVEKKMKENNIEMNQSNLSVMDAYWDEAKGRL
jgi:tetrapyrrole methylase family protein/MazG family protein